MGSATFSLWNCFRNRRHVEAEFSTVARPGFSTRNADILDNGGVGRIELSSTGIWLALV